MFDGQLPLSEAEHKRKRFEERREALARVIEGVKPVKFNMVYYDLAGASEVEAKRAKSFVLGNWLAARSRGVGCIACHARRSAKLKGMGLELPRRKDTVFWSEVSNRLADWIGADRQQVYNLTSGASSATDSPALAAAAIRALKPALDT